MQGLASGTAHKPSVTKALYSITLASATLLTQPLEKAPHSQSCCIACCHCMSQHTAKFQWPGNLVEIDTAIDAQVLNGFAALMSRQADRHCALH